MGHNRSQELIRSTSEIGGGGEIRLDGDVGSGKGRHYCRVCLVSGRVKTRSYKIISLPEPRESCDLLMAVEKSKN